MLNTAEMLQTLQATMQDDVGAAAHRGQAHARARRHRRARRATLGDRPPGDGERFDMRRIDWFDLRNMLLVARVGRRRRRCARTESRGAQQREDFPDMLPDWAVNQFVRLRGRTHRLSRSAAAASRGGGAMSETRTLKIWRGATPRRGPLGDLRGAVRAGPVGARRPALDPRQPRSVAGDPLLLHQRQCLQGMHDRARRQDRLCLHRAAAAARDDAGAAVQQELVRDLVTEIAPPAERFGGRSAYAAQSWRNCAAESGCAIEPTIKAADKAIGRPWRAAYGKTFADLRLGSGRRGPHGFGRVDAPRASSV